MNTTSYLTHLECSVCAQRFDPNQIQTFCPQCNAPLVAHYDLDSARNHLDREAVHPAQEKMWRWFPLLPVRQSTNIVSLGEGDTPTLHLPNLGPILGMPRLYLKDESSNPTGSFKARGLAAAVSKAKELGVQKVIIPTAGNAGGALAAYASRAGMQASIWMPADTPKSNILESRIAGAEVNLVDGLISDAARMAGEQALREDWFDMSTFKEPYRLEGKKVMGYEIAEAFRWRLPDVILYPTGGGTGLVGIWKAFAELNALGWLETQHLPRMIAVQAAGCAPVVRAFEAGAQTCEFFSGAQTRASGLRVPKSFADRMILSTLRESGGAAVAVDDNSIFAAQARLARTEGIFCAPEGAATLAGLQELLRRGTIHPSETVVLLNTGTGLKYLDLIG
jgi:threonine synthase